MISLNRLYFFFLFSFFLAHPLLINSQIQSNSSIDSLLGLVKFSKQDTVRVNLLLKLTNQLIKRGSYDIAFKYVSNASALSKKLKYNYGVLSCYNYTGIIYRNKGDNVRALEYYKTALKLSQEQNKEVLTGVVSHNIARIYINQGNYPRALENLFVALKIKERQGNKKRLANSLGEIGNIYYLQNDRKALAYYFKALELEEDIKNYPGVTIQLNAIALYYKNINNNDSSIYFYLKSLEVNKKVNYKVELASAYCNVGEIYTRQNKKEALDHLLQGLKIYEEINNKEGQSVSYMNLGLLFMKQKDYNKALSYFNSEMDFALRSGVLKEVKSAHQNLSQIHELLHDPSKALTHFRQYITIRDSIFNEENTKKLVREEMNFDFEKKEQLALLENVKKEVEHKAQIDKQKQQRNYFVVGFILVLVLALFIYRSYRQKQLSNVLLQDKNKQIEEQKTLVEIKQKEILDSIHYAKRIQNALLPHEKYIARLLDRNRK